MNKQSSQTLVVMTVALIIASLALIALAVFNTVQSGKLSSGVFIGLFLLFLALFLLMLIRKRKDKSD